MREELTTTLVSAGQLNTPIGQFNDVLEIEVVSERFETNGNHMVTSSTVTDRYWLARGVGPVRVALHGQPRWQITGGVVDGKPVSAR